MDCNAKRRAYLVPQNGIEAAAAAAAAVVGVAGGEASPGGVRV